MTPLLKATLWFTLGIFIGLFLQSPFWVLFWIGLTCAFLGLLVRRERHGRAFFWISLLCLGALRGESALWERSTLEKAFGKERGIWVQGIVSEDPELSSHDRQSFYLQLNASRGPWPLKPKLKIFTSKRHLFAYGDRLLVKGLFSPFPSQRNPGGFDRRLYFQGRSLYGTVRVGDFDPILKEKARCPSLLKQGLFAWKRLLLQKIRRALPQREASFLTALLLGDRAEIDPGLWDLLSEIGVVHLLAISGLHVGMVVACLLFFLKALRLPRRFTLIGALLFLWFFVELVGEAPPILRASLMGTLYLVGKLLWRRSNALHAMAVSFLILVFCNPFFLFEAGFQLSFLSVFMILLCLPLGGERPILQNRLHRFLTRSFRTSTVVWLGLLPLIAYHFYLLNPVALVANLFAIPHAFLLVVLGLIWLLFGWWVPFFSQFLLKLLALATSFGLWIDRFFAQIPFGFFRVGRPSVVFIFFYYLSLFLLMVAMGTKLRRRRIWIGTLLFLNLWVWGFFLKPKETPLRVTFFDVGHGDAALCEFPKGGTLLIDGGRRDDSFDCGREVIAPALWAKGYERLDAVVLTHADGDHVGGLPALLKLFRPGTIFESGVPQPGPLFRDYRTAAEEIGVTPVILRRGEEIQGIPGVILEVLHPPDPLLKGTGRDENNNGLVLKIRYGKTLFLFAADLEEEGIQSLLDSGIDLSAEILKFPHHGGTLDNGKRFLETVRPKVAVISVGPKRQYSLPTSRTLGQLADFGARVHQTVQEGVVVVESDGSSYKIF